MDQLLRLNERFVPHSCCWTGKCVSESDEEMSTLIDWGPVAGAVLNNGGTTIEQNMTVVTGDGQELVITVMAETPEAHEARLSKSS